MYLKLSLEQIGKSWTLKSYREYIMGSGPDCDITLPYPNVIASRHLKFSFEDAQQAWQVDDLIGDMRIVIENKPITWWLRYMGVPRSMEQQNILPKKSNARLVICLILLLYILALILFLQIGRPEPVFFSISLAIPTLSFLAELFSAFNDR